jgi:PAS domain S-box-containing protein
VRLVLKACRWGLMVWLFAAPVRALPPQKVITQYGHDKWTYERGVPGESVHQILQSRDGYLWLRTSSGAVRFDGVRFVPMQDFADARWCTESIKAMTLDRKGDLILRGTTRTLLYERGLFTELLPPMLIPNGIVRVIHEGRDGSLWIGGDSSVYRPEKGGMRTLLDGSSWVYAFHEDAQGKLWIGSMHGLFTHKDGEFAQYGPIFSMALAEDAHGQLWVGSRQGLFPVKNGAGDTRFHSPLDNQAVTAILSDRDGNLWIGTDSSGIYRYDGKRWSSFTMGDGLSDNSILSLHEDREGSLWIGTKSGLDRLKDTKLTSLTSREGLAGNETYSIVTGRDGSTFVFSDGKGLTQIKEGVARSFTQAHGLPTNDGASMCATRDGSIWIGTGGGLCRFRNGRGKGYPYSLFNVYISAIAEDGEGLVVATADGKLHAFKNEQRSDLSFVMTEKPSRLAISYGDYVFLMHVDAKGFLWLASSAGLFRCVRTGSGQFSATRITNYAVMSIYDDQEGHLWLTGRTPGLIRLTVADDSMTRFTVKDGLPNDEITCVLGDDQGRLWMSTPDGLVCISVKELEAFRPGQGKALKPMIFGRMDMVATNQSGLPERQPAGARSPDGRLWFTTRKGIAIVDPRQIYRNENVPPVHIEAVVMDRRFLDLEQPLVLGPGKVDLELRYTALSLTVPERVQFKYQLEGYDPGWIEAGTRRMAFYTKLPPGKYRFKVMGSNDDGIWNEAGTSVAFTVKPRFYQTRWFLGIALIGVAGLGLAIHRLRTHRLRSHARNLARIVGERTRSLEEQRAFLRQLLDINPSYIFVKDQQGCFVLVNQAFSSAFGPSEESLVGKTEQELFDQPKELEAFQEGDRSVLEEAREINLPEQTMTDAWGVRHWLQTAKLPVRDSEGQVIQVLTVSTDITRRKLAEEDRERLITELKEALAKVHLLSGYLPICGSCKKIRNDEGYWEQIEGYIQNHSNAEFSHGICPECTSKLYPDYTPSDSGSDLPPEGV